METKRSRSLWNAFRLETIVMMAMVLTTTLSALVITSISYIQGRHSAIQSIQQQLQLSSETMVEKISILKATTTNEAFSQKLNYSLTLNERKFHALHLHPVQLIVTKTGKAVAKRPSSPNQTLPEQVVRDILKKKQGVLHTDQWLAAFSSSSDLQGAVYIIAIPEKDYLWPLLKQQATNLAWSVAAVLTVCLAGWRIIHRATRPIAWLQQAMERLGSGDWRSRIELHAATKDILALTDGFHQMSSNLAVLIEHMRFSSEQIAAATNILNQTSSETTAASEQIAAAVADTAYGAEQQARKSADIASFFQQLADEMEQMSFRMEEARRSTEQAHSQAESGNQLVQRANSDMGYLQQSIAKTMHTIDALKDHSRHITSILSLIGTIAEQTNLLALNAAIEAAKAGEHGLGFSVVAKEIRVLSAQTGQALAQIQSIVQDVQSQIEAAVQSMKESAKQLDETKKTFTESQQAFKEITTMVSHSSAHTLQISEQFAAIERQISEMREHIAEIATVAQQIASSMEQISHFTDNQHNAMAAIRSEADALNERVLQWRALLETFHLPSD
ncbi:methyl-accepting chemotaxis protein [Geobacillus stearothermophilus]|uniref:methyl-accepting chemotaxis protein n=1 Tax=Geobacillus stearothermophilus TaxID=1422 RepID=UPI002E1C920B|nr:methyl-accepting chemotaxis protein [Geobacillus stearothermophilus]MED4300002.1 methyl-accepting chemotaxis protein [Geobacillus stearothermophilus]